MFKVAFGLCEEGFLVGVAHAHCSDVTLDALIPAAGHQTILRVPLTIHGGDRAIGACVEQPIGLSHKGQAQETFYE